MCQAGRRETEESSALVPVTVEGTLPQQLPAPSPLAKAAKKSGRPVTLVFQARKMEVGMALGEAAP